MCVCVCFYYDLVSRFVLSCFECVRTIHTSLPDGTISTRLEIRTLNTYQHLMGLKEDIGRDIDSER